MTTKYNINDFVHVVEGDSQALGQITSISIGPDRVIRYAVYDSGKGCMFKSENNAGVPEDCIRNSYGQYDGIMAACIKMCTIAPESAYEMNVDDFITMAMTGLMIYNMGTSASVSADDDSRIRKSLRCCYDMFKKMGDVYPSDNEDDKIDGNTNDGNTVCESFVYDGKMNFRVIRRAPQWIKDLYNTGKMKQNSGDNSMEVSCLDGPVKLLPGDSLVKLNDGTISAKKKQNA